MILALGSFEFEMNEVWFIPTARVVLGQTGRYAYIQHDWTIHVFITATTLDSLKTKILAREAGAANITGDVVFKEDDGTPTAHKIDYAATVSGIRVSLASYPGGMTSYGNRAFGSGAEMADSTQTFRYQVLRISAQEIANEYSIMGWQQSYQYSVGGTQFAIQGAFLGLPRRFNLMQSVPCWAVQEGRVIGLTDWPALPAPVVSTFAMDPELSWVKPESPQRIGTLNAMFYPVAFRFFFRDTVPMAGVPEATP